MYVCRCVYCVCVVTNTIYIIATMLASSQGLQSCGSPVLVPNVYKKLKSYYDYTMQIYIQKTTTLLSPVGSPPFIFGYLHYASKKF